MGETVIGTANSQQDLDNLMDIIAQKIAEDETGVSVVDSQKMQCIEMVSEAMKQIITGTDVKISCELHEPYASMGAVSVVGKEIIVTDTKSFALAAKLASNIEVYPKVDGTTQINFTFHNLTRKVGN